MRDGLLKNVLTLIVLILVVALSFSFEKKDSEKKEEQARYYPLKSVSIMGNKVPINDETQDYEFEIDCSKYELNNQIISYELKSEDNKVEITSLFYKDGSLLENPSKTMTNFSISLKISNDKTKIAYKFKVTCRGE